MAESVTVIHKPFNELSSYPPWFQNEVRGLRIHQIKGADRQAMLTESRKDFAAAWSNFFSEVRSVVQLHVYIYTFVAAVVYFGLKDAPDKPWILVVGGFLLWLSIFIGKKSKIVLKATFSLYVASCIFSCQLHLASGFATHRWFETVQKTVWKKSLPTTSDELTDAWASGSSTLLAYMSMVTGLQWLSWFGGILLIVSGLWLTILAFVASR